MRHYLTYQQIHIKSDNDPPIFAEFFKIKVKRVDDFDLAVYDSQ